MRNGADFSCLEHFFQMPVNPKVFGSERTDEPQMLEIERSLLQHVHITTHSATTTSDAPYFVFKRHKGGHGSPDNSRWVSVQRDVTDGYTCPQVLTKSPKVEPQCTQQQNNKCVSIRGSGTNRFVTWFGAKASAIWRAEVFSV